MYLITQTIHTSSVHTQEHTWDTPWRVTWNRIPTSKAHPRWRSGYIDFDTDGNTGRAVVWQGGRVRDNSEQWVLRRARHVGGPGAISMFSTRRRRQAPIEQLLHQPFPPCNRQDYSVALPPLRPPTRERRTFKSWNELFRGGRYAKVTKWFRAERLAQEALITAATRDPDKVDTTLDPDAVYRITRAPAAPHRLPGPLIMDASDMHGKLGQAMWFRDTDGIIKEVFKTDPPLCAPELNAAALRRDWQLNTPWWNAALFDNIDRGFAHPRAHDYKLGLSLRPYSPSLYGNIWEWYRCVRKVTKEDAKTKIFGPRSVDELPSWPFAVVLRSCIDKAGTTDKRQICEHNRSLEEWAEQSNCTRHAQAPYNDRMKLNEADFDYPNLEMVKGADVGMVIAIFEAYGIEVALYIYDIHGYFHRVGVAPRRAAEQGTLTTLGPTSCHRHDMGLHDAPMNTGGISSFTAHSVGRALDTQLKVHKHIVTCKNCQRYRAERSKIFGFGSTQAYYAVPLMYSDDLAVLAPTGLGDIIRFEVCVRHGPDWGLAWEEDKKGANILIGYEYRMRGTGRSTQHIRAEKLLCYAHGCDAMLEKTNPAHAEADKLLGQLNFAGTIELGVKPCAKPLNTNRHVKSRLYSDIHFPLVSGTRQGLIKAASICRANKGLPLMCDTARLTHGDPTVITQRGDACLKEDDGYNGFGIWWLVPNRTGPPTIYATGEKWSPSEEQAFGRNIAAAEAATQLMGDRTITSREWPRK